MTALAAIAATVPRPKLGGTTATTSSSASPDAATCSATRSGVGSSTGSPSVRPRAKSSPPAFAAPMSMSVLRRAIVAQAFG